jgi:hypothetical protein
MDDFFIGYDWPAPPGLWRTVRRSALGLGVGVVGLSAVLAVGHRPLEGGTFEFGNLTGHRGTIVEAPFPMLRPDDARKPWPLLAARGKHGASFAVRGLDGRAVTVNATRIGRGAGHMLEIVDVRVEDAQASRRVDREPRLARGPGSVAITLVGEIVDTKCYLGVMVPGDGATHRACAALCLRGGLPPALRVRDAGGEDRLYLIAGSDATRQAVVWAGETVEMTGVVTRQGGWPVLSTEPGAWRRH